MLNGIAKGQAITTRANRKLQVDALKKALVLNHYQYSDTRNDDINSSSDATCNSSFIDNNNNNSSNPGKGLPGEKALPDKYFCEGLPDK